MAGMARKALDEPDEIREIPKGRIELFTLGGGTVYRASLQPGWRWSESLREAVGTESCPKDHILHVLSGRIHVRMDDGTQDEQGPGELWRVPPGHDAWVVGDEPAVFLDFAEARA